MPEESKSASNLHATAKAFVPVAPGPDDRSGAAVPPASSTAAVGPTRPTNSRTTSAASVAAAASQQNDNAGAAAAVQGAKAGGAGGKGTKAAGIGKQSAGQSMSQLAAAALAPPFVPGKTGAAAAGNQPTSKEPKQQARQGGKAGKGQQQQNRQQQQQQRDPQQKEANGQQQPLKEQQSLHQQSEESKDASKSLRGRMSAAAAAFVPRILQTPSPAAASAGTAASGASSASNSSNNSNGMSQQLQPGRPASASIPAAAARLKSPLRAGPITSINNTAPAPPSTAVHASPVRSAGPSGRGRSMRGDTSGSRMPNALGLCIGPNPSTSLTPGHGVLPPSGVHNMYASSATGFQGAGRGIAAMSGPMGGPKRALLAEFQGNYGHYGAVGGFGGYQQHHVQKHHLGSVPGKQLLSGQFLMDGLRQQLQQNNYLVQLQYNPSSDEPPLPEKIGHYHTLYPLEDLAAADAAGVSAAWGVRTNILKGISAQDGKAYALRVVCGKQVIPSHEMLAVVRSAIDAWSCLSGHPGLLVPVDVLVSAELDGSQSLVVVHSYIPGAASLTQAHLQPTQTVSGQLIRNTPTQDLLWSYTVQLAATLRAAHASGLALRPAALSATKVLVTPVGRLKVSGLGVAEALTGEVVPQNSEDLTQLQRDDVVAMGQLLLQLACAVNAPAAPSLDFASMHYSMEFVRLLMLLLGVADGAAFNWRAVSALLGERVLLEMDSLARFNEQLLEDLSKEMENGRLFRLISKLGFVTDRPADAQQQGQSPAWSETGDRYLLQLFKDFVFHQGELDTGRVIDWGHIIEALNKLDAGVSEQVLLQSRDERSLLVVSYADVKRCIEAAITELRTRGSTAGPSGVGSMMRPHTVAAGMGAAHMYSGMGR